MGAEQFEHFIGETDKITTAQQAFDAAVDEACYDHGHAGYTGTIGEKADFTIIESEPLSQPDAASLAGSLVQEDDPRIDDKWGPAGCLRVEDKEQGNGWLFFGWASS